MFLDCCDALSVYQPIAILNEDHRVALVQHIYSKRLFVKKELSVYSRPVYDYILKNPVLNMPQIFELVEKDGILTVIEEYISGDTLDFLLANRGLYTEVEVINIGLQLCKILRQLHQASPAIVHRDIKPSNIIISPDGVVKLLDMNAAKQFTPSHQQDTQMMGTFGYAAPEQYGFMQSSVQSDIYAVGALMNMLLTGQLPSRKLYTGKLGVVIQKCVEIAPKDRYLTVDALAEALAFPKKAHPGYGHSWQKFLPPGLRSLQAHKMAIALPCYLLAYFISTTLEVQNGTPYQTYCNRIAMSIALMLIIFFSCNYLQIQKRLPITNNSKRIVRFLGVAFYDYMILMSAVIAASIVGG